MNADQSQSQCETGSAGRTSLNKRAVLLIFLTLAVCVVAIVFVQPRIAGWLEMRAAFTNLSVADFNVRRDAIRWLRSQGEEAAGELILLMQHTDAGVRSFAISELAHTTSPNDDVIEAFLVPLESSQPVSEINHQAPSLFYRYAKDATGPLTETDRRMIAWLKSELNSSNPDQSGAAAWALTAFLRRDPTLREPLVESVRNMTFFYGYIAMREMAPDDPAVRAEYIDLLLRGLQSPIENDQLNAKYGLTHLVEVPDDLVSRLESLRETTTAPEVSSRIDEVLEKLSPNDTAEP